MSVAFVPDWLRGKAQVNQETIQQLLEENDQLIRCIVEYQNKGRANECVQNYAPFITEKYYFIVTQDVFKKAMLFPSLKKNHPQSLAEQLSGIVEIAIFGYQHVLHRNLIYLATIADANPTSPSKIME